MSDRRSAKWRSAKLKNSELELELIQHQMTQKPMLRCEGDGAPVRAANKPRSQEKKCGVCVVSHCLWLSAPTALKWRPISLLVRGVKMYAYLNERAFREVKDGQHSANRCFVPGATPWKHLSFFGLFMRWVGIFSLSPTRVVQCAARVFGRNVSCFKRPNQGAVARYATQST